MSAQDLAGWQRELVAFLEGGTKNWGHVASWSSRAGLDFQGLVKPWLLERGARMQDGGLTLDLPPASASEEDDEDAEDSEESDERVEDGEEDAEEHVDEEESEGNQRPTRVSSGWASATTRERQDTIVEIIRRHGSVGTETIAGVLGVDKTHLHYYQARLEKEGRIQRVGSGNKTVWALASTQEEAAVPMDNMRQAVRDHSADIAENILQGLKENGPSTKKAVLARLGGTSQWAAVRAADRLIKAGRMVRLGSGNRVLWSLPQAAKNHMAPTGSSGVNPPADRAATKKSKGHGKSTRHTMGRAEMAAFEKRVLALLADRGPLIKSEIVAAFPEFTKCNVDSAATRLRERGEVLSRLVDGVPLWAPAGVSDAALKKKATSPEVRAMVLPKSKRAHATAAVTFPDSTAAEAFLSSLSPKDRRGVTVRIVGPTRGARPGPVGNASTSAQAATAEPLDDLPIDRTPEPTSVDPAPRPWPQVPASASHAAVEEMRARLEIDASASEGDSFRPAAGPEETPPPPATPPTSADPFLDPLVPLTVLRVSVRASELPALLVSLFRS